MKNLITAIVCAVGFATGASAATTASFDFAALADSLGEGVVEGQNFFDNGLAVTVTSSHFAYFDETNNQGRPAGLGVCQVNSNSCGGDDNVTSGEFITLTFNHVLTAINSATMFRDADHFPLGDDDSEVFDLSGNTFGSFTYAFDIFQSVNALVTGPSQLTFAYNNTEFYLSKLSVEYDEERPVGGNVPLPAGLPLMLGALAILGVARRRKAA